MCIKSTESKAVTRHHIPLLTLTFNYQQCPVDDGRRPVDGGLWIVDETDCGLCIVDGEDVWWTVNGGLWTMGVEQLTIGDGRRKVDETTDTSNVKLWSGLAL